MARTDSFVFYLSFREATKEMSDAEALETILGICDYALYGDEPTLTSALSRAVFAVAKPVIDSNLAKKAGGKTGGRPRKTEKPMVFSSKTIGFEKNNHRLKKIESNVNENENNNVNVNENDNVNVTVNIDKEEDEEKEIVELAAKLRNDGLARVMSLYMDRIEPMPSRTSVELLKGYVEQLGQAVCERAIERAIDAGARKWTYIHAILKNCEKDGIRSLADWDRREEERKKLKERGEKNAGTEKPASSKYNIECIVL